MNAHTLARMLGWFSLALGTMEIAAPATLSRQLGLRGGPWLVRWFGLREIAAGLAIFAKPDNFFGPASRVAGDAMDIAVLADACGPSSPRRVSAEVALGLVLGVTVLDILCTSALAREGRRRRQTARRTLVATSERPMRA